MESGGRRCLEKGCSDKGASTAVGPLSGLLQKTRSPQLGQSPYSVRRERGYKMLSVSRRARESQIHVVERADGGALLWGGEKAPRGASQIQVLAYAEDISVDPWSFCEPQLQARWTGLRGARSPVRRQRAPRGRGLEAPATAEGPFHLSP